MSKRADQSTRHGDKIFKYPAAHYQDQQAAGGMRCRHRGDLLSLDSDDPQAHNPMMFRATLQQRGKALPVYAARYETHPRANSRSFAFYDEKIDFDPFEWHYHPELELVYFPTASGIRMVGDSIENIHRGDLCLIGSNTPHTWSISIKNRRPERCIQIQFLPEFLGESFLNLPEMKILTQLFENAKRGLKILGPARRSISEKLIAISEMELNTANRFCSILALLVEIAQSRHLEPLSTVATLPAIGRQVDGIISKVLEFTRTHIEGDASQSKAAALVGMSPASFSRFFRQHFGKTYTSFINEVRISKVCSLLLETNMTISQAAFAAGFWNLSHFNEQFLLYKKRTPSEHRKWIRHRFPLSPGAGAQ